jgi:hypothetical protein
LGILANGNTHRLDIIGAVISGRLRPMVPVPTGRDMVARRARIAKGHHRHRKQGQPPQMLGERDRPGIGCSCDQGHERMVRQRIIDGQPIGDLYKRSRNSDKTFEHETENLRQVKFALHWEFIPLGRTVHFWPTGVADATMAEPIPMAEPQKLDLTIIGSLSGRRGNGKRFRVDAIHGIGFGGALKNKDFNALISIIKCKLQEEFPSRTITSMNRDVFVLEEKAWDS